MINEQISAYLDGEASTQETENLLATYRRDPAVRQAMSRQYWLRHALRDGRPVALNSDFSSRVLAQLDDADESQPALDTFATQAAREVTHKPAANAARWQRPVAGFAIAASVVGALVLVGNPLGSNSSQPASSELASPLNSPVNPPGTTLQAATESATPKAAADFNANRAPTTLQTARSTVPVDHWSVADPALEDQLNGYLIEHNGFARGYGLSGATPSLVRVATYGAGQ